MMEETDWAKYNDESIDFALYQSTELLKETMTSFRQITNKTYGLLAIYFGVLSYASNNIVGLGLIKSAIPFGILILGVITGIYIIWNNALPSKMNFIGAKPSKIIHKYFEQFIGDNVVRQQKIFLLESQENAIEKNYKTIGIKQQAFKDSILVVWITLFIFAIVFIFI